ncbi:MULTISPECIES: ABC transporter substrate-binding protein [Staphylococcus]|uniref:ABC transporter substrate-binding protein n=1 Tax=Staphylococcus TaxID=1279 RepID=UPI00086CDCC1|nr:MULTISPECIES: ABC transporter substrate-binding protein [Staphylococcus]ODB81947.1 Vitamin B12 ABC transporter substrate-binding protein [Staphylococcus sp. AOAB]RQX27261.1 ABC transporter substrate-binding protein [Staphylococcus warneri]MCO0862049.1 ABC transporter substrate-binding protein [Staphylococcus pasteuri]MCO5360873.1 ABC transporter substrate-binding protein [Staphylococcus pasteuri]OFV09479.1 Vitamin B12 ABC transporter substrate-binding protein [Staphylococcus sp. HMSC13A10]
MKRHLWIVMIATILILAGCSQGNDSKSSNNKDKQASDGKSPYHRIVSLMPSNTEILYELGLGDNVVGVSTVDDYPKNVKKGKKQFDSMNLNKEALLKAKPDLILAHESQKSSSGKVLDSLKKDGIKVVYVKDAQSIDETYDTFKSIGKLTHKEKQANQLVKETKDNVNKVVQSIPKHHKKQNVFIEVSSKPDIYTAGQHTFFNDMLNKLQAKNSFNDIEGWKSVSKESIIKHNPDIFISTEGMPQSDYKKIIEKRGGFDKTNGVKHNRIETVNGDEISRPGPRIDDGLKELRDAIYKK